VAISALEHATPDMIGTGGATGAGATAILAEIAALLERVAAGGEAVQIDLGEVLIRLKADGESTIRETSVQGVWWNEHTDRYGNLLAAFLEVARVPAILPVDSEQLRRGAERLRADLQTVSKTVD
jgi:hypothetical protein